MQDLDPVETQEWLDALESVLDREGEDRAHYLMTRMGELATRSGTPLPYGITTPYRNTIPVTREAKMPGDLFMERRIRSLVRWNALAMVMRANLKDPDLGGHISTFASSATLYDIGFNYFFQAPTEEHGGDLIYYQGHASPGIYARAFLEGRLTEEQMLNFRQEVDGKGLSSYPHPHLMPDFWQFPTVSMGLGPITAIYQARFMKYLENRGFIPKGKQRVWCFIGDGECDEPETLGAISLAGRENLDNLVFVINCNLQRLDGPVRGNGKIIQELEGVFKGANWNVNKVVWGRLWDPLFAVDEDGRMQRRMDQAIDGEYQNYKAKDGAYVRKHFFGADPELLKRVESMSDEEVWKLNRGGHDPYKVYAAYHQAVHHKGQPTVILAHTIKGYGLTETSPVVCANPHGEHSRLGTVGLPVPGTTVKVIDDEGNALPLGERGELCVKGPQVMKGYWQRPDATAEVLDEEGWLKTGDIAVIDEDGFVSIVDRKKDLIIVSGFNVYPNEIEDVVMAHPKVAACAAIGVADEKSGEAVKLFVVPSDPTLDQDELHAYCRENFTGYKMPRHYVFRDALPMTPVGKILRRELRDIA